MLLTSGGHLQNPAAKELFLALRALRKRTSTHTILSALVSKLLHNSQSSPKKEAEGSVSNSLEPYMSSYYHKHFLEQ
jgi:hypothetical protein